MGGAPGPGSRAIALFTYLRRTQAGAGAGMRHPSFHSGPHFSHRLAPIIRGARGDFDFVSSNNLLCC